MLVLTRKLGEQIVVPDCHLAVVVIAIEGNRVQLGITAPADVAVYREEIWPGPGPAPAGRKALDQRR
jgi:carbon storage regulator